ncbi:hypothetical protein P389DRAFT_211421 [Cystobasidium minutum MCA 4210]|uniref:uncharacterized protein n=1 Tax=Cystobasidium minutum MCA 4210 TaxID=1397322 RepID=UPI0034CD27A4|eukprot:jgi/Rhomi1/211421/estExt_Genemark1.C_4_t30102
MHFAHRALLMLFTSIQPVPTIRKTINIGKSIRKQIFIDMPVSDDDLPPYGQLINQVAGMVKVDPEAALELGKFTEELYPTDFVKTCISILRAQTHAVLQDWEASAKELRRTRVLADLVRKGGRPDYIAHMDNVKKGCEQLDALIPAEYQRMAAESSVAATEK